jgi:RNA polymerase sigma factor (TIGR02999 family)
MKVGERMAAAKGLCRITKMNGPLKNPDDEEFASHVTHVLRQVSGGDQAAEGDLMSLVYDQLRALAQQRMMQERPGHTLQATALVHEAFLKLVGPREIPWAGQAHFYAAAAEAMRRILVDHARTRQREKRGGKAGRVLLNVLDLADAENSEEILALDEALCRLEQQEPEVGEVVRLRFFAGLSVDQTAESLGVSPRSVDRRWKFARAWLFRELHPDGPTARPDHEEERPDS